MLSTPTRHIRPTAATAATAVDLGGLPARAGQQVREGVVYRSGAPGRRGAVGDDRLAGLDVRTVLDLRTHAEVDGAGRVVAAEGAVSYHHLPIAPCGPSPTGAVAAYWRAMNDGRRCLAALLRVIAQPANHPVLFHGSDGRHRTGLAAAVLLGVLGARDDDIVTMHTAMTSVADGDALRAALARARARHGSLVGWARAVGVELDVVERLHEHLLA